ncbi:MAG: hypothetical protein K8R89_07640, partial [Anaerolineae bacterium]|nr:hypothetical protein [Anaerolineae bacterium]
MMGEIQAAASQATFRRLSMLTHLYQEGQVSALMERTLAKLLTHEAEVCQSQLSQLLAALAEFEQQYGRSSDEFYHRFQAGQTDDRMD